MKPMSENESKTPEIAKSQGVLRGIYKFDSTACLFSSI